MCPTSRKGERKRLQQEDRKEEAAVISNHVYRLAFCAALNSVNLGYDLGVSTNAAPKIQASFQLQDWQVEFFLGSLNFWSIFGALLSPFLTDSYGRRFAFIMAAMWFLLGIVIMALSQNFVHLMVARCIVGLGVGVGESLDPMYISEIAPPAKRGALVSWAEAGVSFGVVLGFASSLVFYAIPDEMEWRYMLGLGAVMPCIMIWLVYHVMPESPRWLVAKKQESAARVVLEQLCNSNDSEVDIIINEITESICLEEAAARNVGWRSLLCWPSPAIRRMLTVGVGMAIIQQACGIDSIMFYLSYVLQRAGVTSEIGQAVSLIVLGSVKLGFVFVGGTLLDRFGRRPLLFTSLLGCTASLVAVSLTFLGDDSAGVSQVITVIALAIFLAFFSIGLGPGNWVVISEIFSLSIRAKAMSLAILPNRITATIMASTFLSIAKALSWPGFFMVLAGICLASAAFLYIYLPETKGRSLESMAVYFAEITNDHSILDVEAKLKAEHGSSETSEEEASELEIPAIRSGIMS